MKPVINLVELEIVSHEDGPFAGKYGVIGERIGAQKLGYNLTICPPGEKVCPFHNHRVEEEMFFVLEGEGLLRFGDKEYPLRKYDVIACPPGGPETAHQIINDSDAELAYLSVSTMLPVEVCEYPDSKKIGAFGGGVRHMTRAEHNLDYWVDET